MTDPATPDLLTILAWATVATGIGLLAGGWGLLILGTIGLAVISTAY